MWLGIVKAVMGFGGGIVSKFQERKQTAQDARVAWETVAGRSMNESLKDEFLTVVITYPIWGNFIAALYAAFTGDQSLMLAVQASMVEIGPLLETPYGDLMYIIVVTGVGLKVSSKFIK